MSDEPTIKTAYRLMCRDVPGTTATRRLELARIRMDAYKAAKLEAETADDTTRQAAMRQVSIAAGRAGKHRYGPPAFGSNSPFNPRGEDGLFWAKAHGLKHLRQLGYADELDCSVDHTGWYSDAHQDESYRGVVYLLPQRNGETLKRRTFLVGYADPCNEGCARLGRMSTSYDDTCEDDGYVNAARRADYIAQRDAEEAREYDEHWSENSWLAAQATAVRAAAVAFGEARTHYKGARRSRKTIGTMVAIRGVRDALVGLRGTLQDFVYADDKANDKLGDPLEHESAADHDADLVRRARHLAEMMEVEA